MNETNLNKFLHDAGWADAHVHPITPDSSARRYVRVIRPTGARAVVMIAPVTTKADQGALTAFIKVAAHLRDLGLSAPRNLAQDLPQGFVMVEDFGTKSLAFLLENAPDTARLAYEQAWFVTRHLAHGPRPEWATCPNVNDQAGMVGITFDLLSHSDDLRTELIAQLARALHCCASGPPALSLRDYHADNLMWLPTRAGISRIGLLDFQDALMLPKGYDLASLVDDPRWVVPAAWRQDLIADFATTMRTSIAQANARINTLSLLRNLRIIGIFHRLASSYGRPAYRRFLPRTFDLVDRASRDPALTTLRAPVRALLTRVAPWAAEVEAGA